MNIRNLNPNQKIIFGISVFFFCIGILLFVVHNELIIIKFNIRKPRGDMTSTTTANKKTVTGHFKVGDAWHPEKYDIILTDNVAHNIQQLTTGWLTVLHDHYHQQIRNVILQSAILTPDGSQLYLSFNHNPLPQTGPIAEKLRWVEGLFKTIREYHGQVQSVSLLGNHKPLEDIHLDFSKPWPITGFVS